MNEKTVNKFMILPQAVTKDDPISASHLDIIEKMRSATVQQNVAIYRQKLAQGMSPDNDIMKSYKTSLPLLFCAQGVKHPGKGRSNNLVPSLAVAVDLDGINERDPREIYNNSIAPRIQELKIGMVQITIKGHGLHIWADRNPGETILAAQQRIATALGLQQYLDKKCKDPTRGMFLTTGKDLLYLNPDFFYMTPEQAQQAQLFDETDNNNIHNNNINMTNTYNTNLYTPATAGAMAYTPQTPVQTEYNGAKLTDIVDTFLRLELPDGIPFGQRNITMYKIFINLLQICSPEAAILALKHITDNAQIPQSDITSPCASAYRRIQSGEKVTMSKNFVLALKNSVAEAKYEEEEEEETETDTDTVEDTLPSYPLPTILQLATKNLPTPFITPLLILANPIIGALLTDVTFNYWFDSNIHHFAFLALGIADQSAGKSSLIYPRLDLLAKPLREEDNIAEDEWDRYDRAVERMKLSDELPPKPLHATRIFPTDVTSSAFYGALNRAKQKTGIIYDDEANVFFRTGGGEQYRITREIVKKAYDQSFYKMARKDGTKFSGNIACNIALLGTADVIGNFPSAGEGDLGRFMIATITEQIFHSDGIRSLSLDEKQQLDDITHSLTTQSGTRYAAWIDTEAKKYRDQLEDHYLETLDTALLLLYRRAVVNFTRIAYMFAVLFDCAQKEWNEQPRLEDEEKRQACIAWAKYLADYSLNQTLRFFGKQFRQCAGDIPQMVVYPSLYTPLPDIFTTQDVKDICLKTKLYVGNHNKPLSAWQRAGWIERIENEGGGKKSGKYRKIKK